MKIQPLRAFRKIPAAVLLWNALCFPFVFSQSLLPSADLFQPVPRSAVISEEGYIVWGASMVEDDEGNYHLFYCRWTGKLNDWTRTSEIVHATASSPLGPYQPQEVVLGRRAEGPDAWDGVASFNPTVIKAGKKYYLYYSGSNGSNFPIQEKDGSFKRSPNGTLITQRIGVAVADHPAGPWKRIEKPLIDLSKDGIDSQMCCNPAVTQGPDGRFLMIYKCSNGHPRTPGGGIYLTTAEADTPLGPFRKSGLKILTHPNDNFPVEDPFLWWQDGKFRCLVDDQRGTFSGAKGLIQFESVDGQAWIPSEPFVISRCQIGWEDGTVQQTTHLERPQIWLKNGLPAILFAAVAEGENYFNVHIPFKRFE